jgi:hypothetical protein
MPVVEKVPSYLVRIQCSMLAILICWGIAGLLFNLFIKGPRVWITWLYWGGSFCFIGWILVGIPLVAAGNRIYRIPPTLLTIGVGLCGALIVSLPFSIVARTLENLWSSGGLAFEGSAFLIAASAALLYRTFLIKRQDAESGPG